MDVSQTGCVGLEPGETRALSLLATIARLNDQGDTPTKAGAIHADDPRGAGIPDGSRTYRYEVLGGLLDRGLLTNEREGRIYALKLTDAGRTALENLARQPDLASVTAAEPDGAGLRDRPPG